MVYSCQVSPKKTLYSHLLSPISATYSSHFILLDFSSSSLHSIFCALYTISFLTKINCLSDKSKQSAMNFILFSHISIFPLFSSPFGYYISIHVNFEHKRWSITVPTILATKK